MTTSGRRSGIDLDKLYQCEHSPVRTQIFWIEMLNIPTFVSVHFVRHKIGVEHFATSNRPDRGTGEADRMTPINHGMLINAQALINMAKKRLCYHASKETRETMIAILKQIKVVDSGLSKRMVPECVYRGKICHELKQCDFMKGAIDHCTDRR